MGDPRTPLLTSAPQASFFSPPDDAEPQESTEAPPGSGTFLPTRMAGTTGTAGILGRQKPGY